MSPRRLGLAMLVAGGMSTVLALVLRFVETPAEAAGSRSTETITVSEPAPDLHGFVDAANEPLDPASLRGRVVVLNLLATWCAPCLAELPALTRLAESGRSEGGWTVIGLVADLKTSAELAAFAAESAISFPLYVLPKGGLERRMGVVGYPTTLLLLADGTVAQRVMGPEEWDSPAWVARLRALGESDGQVLP